MHGLAISTFMRNSPNLQERLGIFKHSLLSLYYSEYNGYLCLVDDGSEVDDHLVYANALFGNRINIIKSPENRGIARTKNKCIKAILDAGCDIGFLSDDDIQYFKGFDTAYSRKMESTRIPHFSYYVNKKDANIQMYGIDYIRQTPALNGCFITFTKQLIEDIGYFKIFPNKYGHEHSNFTYRAIHHGKIPYFCDICDSEKYIRLIDASDAIGSIEKNKSEIAENGSMLLANLDVIEEYSD